MALDLQGFKSHSLHDPLSEPGTADLTADVDFAFLKEHVQDKLVTYGPVTQSSFLTNMGIELRLAVSIIYISVCILFQYCIMKTRGNFVYITVISHSVYRTTLEISMVIIQYFMHHPW